MHILILMSEVVHFFQSMRLKLISNNSQTERRFSAWIGGSILASLVCVLFILLPVLSFDKSLDSISRQTKMYFLYFLFSDELCGHLSSLYLDVKPLMAI